MDNAITTLMDLIIPALEGFLSDLHTWLTVALVIGPALLLLFGLIYFFLPPKEANHRFGYRTFFGMGSVEAWRFTQWIAGMVWGTLGLGLLVAMIIVCVQNRQAPVDAYAATALKCLLVQAIATAVCWVGIELTVLICYDKKGIKRR